MISVKRFLYSLVLASVILGGALNIEDFITVNDSQNLSDSGGVGSFS